MPIALELFTEEADAEDSMECLTEKEQLIRIIRDRLIVSHFQPIVDLFSGEVFGYEILSRAPKPFQDAETLFSKAREYNLCWDLEYVCRNKAFEKIAALSGHRRGLKFFMNVSPAIFNDSRLESGLTLASLAQFGIEQNSLVIEITETSQVQDYEFFQTMVRHYLNQGFQIALDDFGAGHSSLITLVAASPNFLKIDRELISNIHKQSYKQHLLRSVQGFASNVDSMVVAEGIEMIEELQTVMRMGIRYGQGFFLARPEPEIIDLPKEKRDQLRTLFQRYHATRLQSDDQITNIMAYPPTIQIGTMTCEDVEQFFHKSPAVDHIVMLDGDRPLSIIEQHGFYKSTGGPFGYSLLQKKRVESLAKNNPLIVHKTLDVGSLGRLVMNRQREDLYDPVIVVNKEGAFVGTITIKQLLVKFISREIKMAADANPLTKLPGNNAIEAWIADAIASNSYSVIYGDLDCFKQYNDLYGFSEGDRMIRFASTVLADFVSRIAGLAQLGHVGGDDFVIVADSVVNPDLLGTICRSFDERKNDLFRPEHVEAGKYLVKSRGGQLVECPLVTLSLVMVSSDNFEDSDLCDSKRLSNITARLKSAAKAENAKTGKSGYYVEQRYYR